VREHFVADCGIDSYLLRFRTAAHGLSEREIQFRRQRSVQRSSANGERAAVGNAHKAVALVAVVGRTPTPSCARSCKFGLGEGTVNASNGDLT
jgi:hypothetical protein